MNHFSELFLGLMVAIAALSTVARLIGVPYPILLVLGGLVLGLIPGCRTCSSTRTWYCVIFLPPLLYSAAFFASLRDLGGPAARSHCSRWGWCSRRPAASP